MPQSALVRDVLPDFYRRALKAMQDEGYPELAAQMPSLVIDHVCRCGQDDCASFSCVSDRRESLQYKSSTDIHGDFGEALVDVSFDGTIIGFDLLGWDELRPLLQAWASRR